MNQVANGPDFGKTWAQSRLRLGQANVGTWVVLSTVWLLVASPGQAGSFASEASQWVAFVVAYGLLQAGFDVVGGYLLPSRFGRLDGDLGTWAAGWLRGVAVHTSVVSAVGVGLLAAAQVGGWAVAAVAVLSTLALAVGHGTLFVLSTGIEPMVPHERLQEAAQDMVGRRVVLARTTDRSFRGGWTGVPGREVLLLPETWSEDSDLLAVQLRRRAIALDSGAWTRGVVAAVLFNLTGWCLASWLVPGAGWDTAVGLSLVSAGYTLWGFLGLLMLPRFSRQAVHAVDAGAAELLGNGRVSTAVRRLDEDQEDEDDRSETVGTIYHPVPTPSRRIAALSAPVEGPSLYRVTRLSLFFSWAQLSPLSRAVHCNIGRPELWVLLPGD